MFNEFIEKTLTDLVTFLKRSALVSSETAKAVSFGPACRRHGYFLVLRRHIWFQEFYFSPLWRKFVRIWKMNLVKGWMFNFYLIFFTSSLQSEWVEVRVERREEEEEKGYEKKTSKDSWERSSEGQHCSCFPPSLTFI